MTTPYFYDKGEEAWPRKIHAGAGGVYLKGYINVDAIGELSAQAHPSRIMANVASIEDYYGAREGDAHHLPVRRPAIIDLQADLGKLPFEPSSVDKIVCVQALEHMHPKEMSATLTHWWNILKDGAPLILTVPDCDATLDMIHDDPDFAVRHLRGSLKDEYSTHLTWFSSDNLVSMLEEHGFTVAMLPNAHFYPAICVRARKDDGYMLGREYQELGNWAAANPTTVLDVGPGTIPFKHATHYADKVSRNDLDIPGYTHDLNDLPLPWTTNGFDYVYASHVLEHTNEPCKVAAELVRVGKWGYIEVPTVMLDYAMHHGTLDRSGHGRWQCLQIRNGIVMVEMWDAGPFNCNDWGVTMWNITQSKNWLTARDINIRRHFWANQQGLNASAMWGPDMPLNLTVVHKGGKVEKLG